jgi:hypothetical protein
MDRTCISPLDLVPSCRFICIIRSFPRSFQQWSGTFTNEGGYFHQWEDYALFALFIFSAYANLHDFVAPRSLKLPQYRTLRTDMRFGFNSRPRRSCCLHLRLAIQTLRGRTHLRCRGSRPRLHSKVDSVWHPSDARPWSLIALSRKQSLGLITNQRLTRRTVARQRLPILDWGRRRGLRQRRRRWFGMRNPYFRQTSSITTNPTPFHSPSNSSPNNLTSPR